RRALSADPLLGPIGSLLKRAVPRRAARRTRPRLSLLEPLHEGGGAPANTLGRRSKCATQAEWAVVDLEPPGPGRGIRGTAVSNPTNPATPRATGEDPHPAGAMGTPAPLWLDPSSRRWPSRAVGAESQRLMSAASASGSRSRSRLWWRRLGHQIQGPRATV